MPHLRPSNLKLHLRPYSTNEVVVADEDKIFACLNRLLS
jgi:hypothetical protein